MSLILESYNKDAETTLLRKARDNTPEATSLVGIVDNEKQTILSIKVGSSDRETIQKIVQTWSHAEHRYVAPGEHLPRFGIKPINSYHTICDALLKLNSPVLYRKAEHESKDGYPIDAAALQTIIEAAKKEVFANVRLAGCTSSYAIVSYDEEGKPIQDMTYTAVTVEFNIEPWEPPVIPPPSLPKNLFQKVCDFFARR
jgi:hypothetical protein